MQNCITISFDTTKVKDEHVQRPRICDICVNQAVTAIEGEERKF